MKNIYKIHIRNVLLLKTKYTFYVYETAIPNKETYKKMSFFNILKRAYVKLLNEEKAKNTHRNMKAIEGRVFKGYAGWLLALILSH